MKKIFTSVLFAMCAFVGLSAQSFEFRMNGEKVADGATVTFSGSKHIIKPQYEYKTKDILSLNNLTASDLNYSAEIEVMENTMNGYDIQICMGGQCQNVTGTTFKYDSPEPLPANGSTGTLFDAYSKQTTGHMLTKLTVTANGESHNVIVRFEYSDPSGIDEIRNSGGVVDVYNVAGNLVKSSYDVDRVKSLPHGLYIIRGKNTKAYKVVVK